MNQCKTVVVAGLGEVGRPLLDLLSKHHDATGVDVAPFRAAIGPVDVLHICYPFQIADFVGESAHYIELFQPGLTIIHSSVPVGTTRAIAKRTRAAVAHSPVRGKHACMVDELLHYVKFVGAIDQTTAERSATHCESIGMKTKVLSSPEATELAKLTETTYFGLLIAWGQDVERACDSLGQNYNDVVSFYDEVGFFPPVKYVPGVIGGHCVMPNIELLKLSADFELIQAIQSSNRKKSKRDFGLGESSGSCARPDVASSGHGSMTTPMSRS
jgi:UDP-N-acetyl-D-mannosaminuronate dehydrogenase